MVVGVGRQAIFLNSAASQSAVELHVLRKIGASTMRSIFFTLVLTAAFSIQADEREAATDAIATVIATLDDAQRAANAVVVQSDALGTVIITSRNVIAGAEKVEIFFRRGIRPVIAERVLAEFATHNLVLLDIEVPEGNGRFTLRPLFPPAEVQVVYAETLERLANLNGRLRSIGLTGDLLPEYRQKLFGFYGDELVETEGNGLPVSLIDVGLGAEPKSVAGVLSCAPVIARDGSLAALVQMDSFVGLEESNGMLGGICADDLRLLLEKADVGHKRIHELPPSGFFDAAPHCTRMLLNGLSIRSDLRFEEGDLTDILGRTNLSWEPSRKFAVGEFQDDPSRKIYIEMALDPRDPGPLDHGLFVVCGYKPIRLRNERHGWLVVRDNTTSAIRAIAHYDQAGEPSDVEILFRHGRPQLLIGLQDGKQKFFCHSIDGVGVQSGELAEIEGSAKKSYEELRKILRQVKIMEVQGDLYKKVIMGRPMQMELGAMARKQALKIQAKENAGRMRQRLNAGF